MSALGIPQIAVVMGSCTAGGAYVPAMSDETVIVKNQGTIFLGGPPLVKAATGEVVTAEELGGGDVHTASPASPTTWPRTTATRSQIARRHRRRPQPPEARPSVTQAVANRRATTPRGALRRRPARPAQALRRPRGDRAPRRRPALPRVQARYGTTLVTGFAHLHGYPVGILANNGVLFSEAR